MSLLLNKQCSYNSCSKETFQPGTTRLLDWFCPICGLVGGEESEDWSSEVDSWPLEREDSSAFSEQVSFKEKSIGSFLSALDINK